MIKASQLHSARRQVYDVLPVYNMASPILLQSQATFWDAPDVLTQSTGRCLVDVFVVTDDAAAIVDTVPYGWTLAGLEQRLTDLAASLEPAYPGFRFRLDFYDLVSSSVAAPMRGYGINRVMQVLRPRAGGATILSGRIMEAGTSDYDFIKTALEAAWLRAFPGLTSIPLDQKTSMFWVQPGETYWHKHLALARPILNLNGISGSRQFVNVSTGALTADTGEHIGIERFILNVSFPTGYEIIDVNNVSAFRDFKRRNVYSENDCPLVVTVIANVSSQTNRALLIKPFGITDIALSYPGPGYALEACYMDGNNVLRKRAIDVGALDKAIRSAVMRVPRIYFSSNPNFTARKVVGSKGYLRSGIVRFAFRHEATGRVSECSTFGVRLNLDNRKLNGFWEIVRR